MDIEVLISNASQLIPLSNQEEITAFIEKVAQYLDAFDQWLSEFNQKNISLNDTELLKKISDLNTLHQQILGIATQHKNEVGSLLSGVHKRSIAIKKYIDPFPERVSITGKRKG